MIVEHETSSEDQGFLQAFEAFEFPPGEFDHRAHVRLAYIYLCAHSVDQASELMKKSLLGFLHHIGVDESKYHETLTRSWILAVRHFMEKSTRCSSAAEFIEGNTILLDTKIMLSHYSAEVLFSNQAREQFMEPDLERIPEY
jgi:hypothetical protein